MEATNKKAKGTNHIIKSQQVKLKQMDKMEEKNDRLMFLPKKKNHKHPKRTTRLFKFEVQDQGNSNDEDCDDGANNPLVLAHPS